MTVLRTPDECFGGLPDFAYDVNYAEVTAKDVEPLRMAYVDVGPREGSVVLLLHGQPTWSFLYRHVIAVLSAAGFRVIAPDHIGYGRSDKLSDPTDYSLKRHIGWIESLIIGLDLRGVTLVAQDWGGPIGLSVLARVPHRFARVIAANTILHTCDPDLAGKLEWAAYGIDGGKVVLQEALVDYLMHYARAPQIVPSLYVNAVSGPLSDQVKAAYDAPFPDPSYTAGLRQMTALLPLTRNDPGAVIGRQTMGALREWTKPFLTAYSDSDPATRGWDAVFRAAVPGAAAFEPVTIAGAGHFLQETHGAELAAAVIAFMAASAS